MRRDSATSQNGVEFVSCDALVFGDYGGAGSVGRANIDFLKDKFKDKFEEGPLDLEDREVDEDTLLYIGFGGYNSEQAWLRNTPEAEEMLDELDDYPAFDDQYVSDVEMKWEEEAWDWWAKDDLLRNIGDTPITDPDQGVEVTIQDLLDKMDDKERDALLWDVYRAAMDKTNTYPTPEYNGSHIDIDRIEETFTKILTKKLVGPFPAQGQQELPLGESRMTEDECQSCGSKMSEDEGYEVFGPDGAPQMWCEDCTADGAVECAECDRHLDGSVFGLGDTCPMCDSKVDAGHGWPRKGKVTEPSEEEDDDLADPDCDECGGDGLVSCQACGGEGYDNTDAKCDECWGTGMISCPTCYDNPPQEGPEDNFTDPEADADTLRSAGMGTDEDYGGYGSED